jgi:NADP-dependent 3-hydroxy acid dehydrogenase YdfG
VAVITGGGSGIGAATARALAADGWTVVIAGRRAEALDEVAAGDDRIDPVPADVTDEAGVRRLFETVVARHLRVDLLFNNAGTSTALDGRPFDIACGQIDIGNAATTMATGSVAGTPQADGGIRPEPVMDVAEAARAVRYMASLPLDANVLTMTVMATRMPYVGRG